MKKTQSKREPHPVIVAADRRLGADSAGRRDFLKRGAKAASALALGGAAVAPVRADEPVGTAFPAWSKTPGTPMRTYGMPSRYEEPIKRHVTGAYGTLSPGTGSSRAIRR